MASHSWFPYRAFNGSTTWEYRTDRVTLVTDYVGTRAAELPPCRRMAALCVRSAAALDDWVELVLDWSASGVERASDRDQRDCGRLGPLLRLIERFRDEGYPSGVDGEVVRITAETAGAAACLLGLLPQESPLPKLLPDGEGALIMAWDRPEGSTLLTVDGWTLHTLTAFRTPSVRRYDDVPFAGDALPDWLRQDLQLA